MNTYMISFPVRTSTQKQKIKLEEGFDHYITKIELMLEKNAIYNISRSEVCKVNGNSIVFSPGFYSEDFLSSVLGVEVLGSGPNSGKVFTKNVLQFEKDSILTHILGFCCTEVPANMTSFHVVDVMYEHKMLKVYCKNMSVISPVALYRFDSNNESKVCKYLNLFIPCNVGSNTVELVWELKTLYGKEFLAQGPLILILYITKIRKMLPSYPGITSP